MHRPIHPIFPRNLRHLGEEVSKLTGNQPSKLTKHYISAVFFQNRFAFL